MTYGFYRIYKNFTGEIMPETYWITLSSNICLYKHYSSSKLRVSFLVYTFADQRTDIPKDFKEL